MAASLQQSHFCVLILSLVLLPGLWHRCDCVVESNPLWRGWSSLDFGLFATGKQIKKTKPYIKNPRLLALRYCHVVPILHVSVLSLSWASKNPSFRVKHTHKQTDTQTDTWTDYSMPPGLCPLRNNYVLTYQGHWDCATHHVAEKDHQLATEVSTSRWGS